METAAMARWRVDVQVFKDFRRELPVKWLRMVAQAALSTGMESRPTASRETVARASMSVVIANDETVLRLNRDYRGLNETTDVLAFSSEHPGHYEGEGKLPALPSQELFITPEDDDFVGEIVISYPQCARQAQELGHAWQHELALLIVHGALHLLGYDHENPDEEREMQSLERKALASAGVHEVRL